MATAAVSPDAAAPDREPVPDPLDDVDALEDLEEEISELAADIHAATHRLLVLLADFDRRRGWELGGHRSCAHWLHRTTGIDLGACRERVRVARALVDLPRTGEAMSRGERSFSQVRALTRVASEECEAELLEVARHATTAELERMIRQWRLGACGGAGGAEAEEERLERRPAFLDPRDRIHMEVGAGGEPAAPGADVRPQGAGEARDGPAAAGDGGARAGNGVAGGRIVKRRPRPRLPERPVEALVEAHRALGIEPEAWKLGRGWRAEIPWPIHARALEALDHAHWEE